MKFELKTENDKYSKSTLHILRTIFSIALICILCDISLKLANISRHYQIEYICRILSVEKSSSNFKKLSNLSQLKNKQRLWEFCKEVIK